MCRLLARDKTSNQRYLVTTRPEEKKLRAQQSHAQTECRPRSEPSDSFRWSSIADCNASARTSYDFEGGSQTQTGAVAAGIDKTTLAYEAAD